MEQLNNPELTIRKNAQTALTLGIIAAVVTLTVLMGWYVTYLAAAINGSRYSSGFFAAAMILTVISLASAVMGFIAWRAGRRAGVYAKQNAVRRPPQSVVGHVLGMVGFFVNLPFATMLLLQALESL